MKYYHKYKEALEDKGYTVDEHGYVWDSTGNQAAGEDNYGNVQSKDPNVTSICQEAEAAMTATPKPRTKKATKKQEPEHEESLEMVRHPQLLLLHLFRKIIHPYLVSKLVICSLKATSLFCWVKVPYRATRSCHDSIT